MCAIVLCKPHVKTDIFLSADQHFRFLFPQENANPFRASSKRSTIYCKIVFLMIFLSCGFICSVGCVPTAPLTAPSHLHPLLPAPQGKVPAPGQLCGDATGKEQELEPAGRGEKWLSRASQAAGCHFHATFLCLSTPRRDNSRSHGHTPHLWAQPQHQCSPQKMSQCEQQVC